MNKYWKVYTFQRSIKKYDVYRNFYYYTNLQIFMSGLYEELCNLFIKPARQTYSDHDLGPFAFGQHGIRQNFTFSSRKGYDIKTSFFKNKNNRSNTCIIYLHSFNGSRLQSLRYASEIIQKDFHFCSFDFPGCGNSGGQYVSLGCNQRWDVLKLLQNLKIRYGLTQFFIWGRSMGAVAAIKFYSLLSKEQVANRYKEFSILGLVLDSAFISLKRMVIEVGQSRVSIPQFLIKVVFSMVSSSIEQKAGLKVEDLELQSDISTIRCSTLLIASKDDTFVNFTHSEQIFNKLRLHDNKQMEYARGEHYESREQKTINNIYFFFQKKYKKYNQILQRSSYLKNSRINCNNIYQQFSLQKHTKSLRKYEPKIQTQKRQEPFINQISIKYNVSSKVVLFQSRIQEKQTANTQLYVASDKKIPLHSYQVEEKQYQTQKKIEEPQLKKTIGGSNKGKLKNELRNKSKPNFIYRIDQVCKKGTAQEDHEQNKSSQRTLEATQNQQNHCNIISDKLRKKCRNHREKIIDFKQLNQLDTTNKNRIQFEKPKTKINFTIGNQVSTPTNLKDSERSSKKLSMTAQQYKNSQIKIIKGVVTLSPSIKRRNEKGNYTQIKYKNEQLKQNQQSRSTNNLIILGGNDRPDTRSYKNMNSLLRIQATQIRKE